MERKNNRLTDIQHAVETREPDLPELLLMQSDLEYMIRDPFLYLVYGGEARDALRRVEAMIDAARAEERARGAHDRGWVMSDVRRLVTKGLFDIMDPPDPASIRQIEVLQHLIGYFRDRALRELPGRVETLEARLRLTESGHGYGGRTVEDIEDDIALARAAIDELLNRTIPAYEERLGHLTEDRDYGLRSDRRPLAAKAGGAHSVYR